MDLTPFTRRILECRKRWNRRTLQYVLEVARIVLDARAAAGNNRRWCGWIRKSLRMNRSTVHRYLRVKALVEQNVALKQHFASLSIAKVHALSRLSPSRVAMLAGSARSASLSDQEFLRMLRRWTPRSFRRPHPGNLMKAMTAAVDRLQQSVRRWQENALVMTAAQKARLHQRLRSVEDALRKIAGSVAAH